MRRSRKRVLKTAILTSLVLFVILLFLNFSYWRNSLKENVDSDFNRAEGLRNEDVWTYRSSELKEWNPAPKVTSNRNHSGQDGSPVNIPANKKAMRDKMFTINQFNLVASDMIPLNRTLEDYTEPECRRKKYQDFLPTTSVVIVFHNEAWSTLFRTVWSIINRSPKELLAEIILVDDASEQDHLKTPLENYVALLPIPVHVFRSENRSGLIRARLLGASHAKGQVLTFLDAHCECSEGWLEPLLSRIAENRKVAVVPIIDILSDENFEYIMSSYQKGGFRSTFVFSWISLTKEEKRKFNVDKTKPYRTPIMAGGLFSIDREYFYLIGSYDEGMDIWGGENIEMSLRIWQCGGSIETAVCSRVGHVFRQKFPHSFPGGQIVVTKNLNRVFEVWLDEWKHYVHALYPHTIVPVGDIVARIQLREKLQCRSFKWFLNNIYPESPLNTIPLYLGNIFNEDSKMCIDTFSREDGDDVGIRGCNKDESQRFIFTKTGEIRTDLSCLDGNRINSAVKVYKCHGMGGNQDWFYNDKEMTIKHIGIKQCIEIITLNANTTLPALRTCNSSNPQQKWILKNDYDWKKYFNKS